MKKPGKTLMITAALILIIYSCNNGTQTYDASGTFETVETIVSSEASGVIKQFNIEEGSYLEAGDTIGLIDTIQLYLKKKQLKAQVTAMMGKKPDIPVQLAALQEQLTQAVREQQRIASLVKADAGTKKQLDDATTHIAVIERQIKAQESTLDISTASLIKETVPFTVQIEQVEDQIRKSLLIAPVTGNVLVKYAEAFEIATMGKPLYKIADLSTLILRVYVSGDQYAGIQLNQQVKVHIGGKAGKDRIYDGEVTWISDRAEFTPKTIQTKDERVNLVYAVKIRVKNDGYLKIGMYGDVIF